MNDAEVRAVVGALGGLAAVRKAFQLPAGRGGPKEPKGRFWGVTWDGWHKKWVVMVYFKGKRKNLGRFDDPVQAAWVREEFILKHGLSARRNFDVGFMQGGQGI